MTDTTNNSIQATEQNLTTLVETLAKGQEKLENAMIAFSNMALQVLTGQPQTAPAPDTSATSTTTVARRRGRQAPAVPAKPRELTADEKYAVDLVKRAGRMTQTDLADTLKIERSLVQARMKEPLRRGLIHAQLIEPADGGHRHVLYRRADWVSIKGE